MAVPTSTYRLQIRAEFDLDAAAAVTGYLQRLGAGWAYLSPLLTATPGSDHGYDVVDVSAVDPARGGPEGLERFADAARAAGLGILIDIVPNHMGVAVPRVNAAWWDLLRLGRESAYAEWFDVDWAVADGRVRVPILGAPLDEVIDDLVVDAAGTRRAPDGVLRYFDHELPLAPGSAGAGDIRAVLDRQHYELRFWRDEASELNYRRFFAVTTLAGVRVELPGVFDATHAEILRWVRDGIADGLRVDHPDGLLDPGAYLARLDAAMRAAGADEPYVLVEKILEHGEELPSWWDTAGTTGYDALGEIDRVLIDPAGQAGLDALDARLRAETGLPAPLPWHDLIHDTKRMIADTIQVAEIRRLVRELPDGGGAETDDALAELLACFPVYRSYLPEGREHLDQAAAEASARRPDLAGAIAGLVPVLADPAHAAARRFQQTTGPVMAKGVEDTAFYRFTRLGSLTEVGGDPSVFALPVAGFHAAQEARLAAWPRAMTTLSTHDTKRGEDVRARLDVLAELPDRWAEVVDGCRARRSSGHGPFDNLLLQAIVGAWPASRERLHAYAEKASREAAEATGWWDPDAAFEERMHAVVDAVFDDPAMAALIDGFAAEIAPYGWSNSLSAKLLQLAGPGVPDVYQGSELWEMSLVDPDNRRPVAFAERDRMLAALDAPGAELPPIDASGAAKLLLVSRTLRLRRDRPELFTRYTPVEGAGEASGHVVAFDRGGAIAVATRLPVGLAALGGWGDTRLPLRAAASDALTGRTFAAGDVPLAELLAVYPVALLVAE
ncbi:malto-oligosyltrehalose synthase [Microbacterium sp. CJ88]|uniref:malto-oligosyltrehalose synthase n=1 Tax=Microbacterium sp. CJ88 TaxID=3445672 RepID=UPI003F65CE60